MKACQEAVRFSWQAFSLWGKALFSLSEFFVDPKNE